MTQVQCPNCKSKIEVTPRLSGRKVKCKCATVLKMPELQDDEPIMAEMVSDLASLPPIQFQCPTCAQTLQVKAEMTGKVTRCPCGTKIRIPAPSFSQAPAPTLPLGQDPMSQNSLGQNPFGQDPHTALAANGKPTLANPPLAGSPFNAGDPFANSETPPNGSPLVVDDPFASPGFAPVGDPFSADGLMAVSSVGIDPLTGQPADIPNVAPRPRPKNIKPKRIVKKRKPEKESSEFEGEIVMGMLAMLGAVVWFVGGLAFGVLFFYPPVLFCLGLGAVIKGMMD